MGCPPCSGRADPRVRLPRAVRGLDPVRPPRERPDRRADELIRAVHLLVGGDERKRDRRPVRARPSLRDGSCRWSRCTSCRWSSPTRRLAIPDGAAVEHRRDAGAAHQPAKALNDRSTPVEAAERLLALVAELDSHDRLTRGHSDRVRAYAQMIGMELHLSADELDLLNWAALAARRRQAERADRDPDQAGAADRRGMGVLRRHPEFGDGAGGPLASGWGNGRRPSPAPRALGRQGLSETARGRRDRACGRIVAVADVFDVITSARSYKSAFASTAARTRSPSPPARSSIPGSYARSSTSRSAASARDGPAFLARSRAPARTSAAHSCHRHGHRVARDGGGVPVGRGSRDAAVGNGGNGRAGATAARAGAPADDAGGPQHLCRRRPGRRRRPRDHAARVPAAVRRQRSRDARPQARLHAAAELQRHGVDRIRRVLGGAGLPSRQRPDQRRAGQRSADGASRRCGHPTRFARQHRRAPQRLRPRRRRPLDRVDLRSRQRQGGDRGDGDQMDTAARVRGHIHVQVRCRRRTRRAGRRTRNRAGEPIRPRCTVCPGAVTAGRPTRASAHSALCATRWQRSEPAATRGRRAADCAGGLTVAARGRNRDDRRSRQRQRP